MLEKITEATIRYLHIQIDAGCDAVQFLTAGAVCLARRCMMNSHCLTWTESPKL